MRKNLEETKTKSVARKDVAVSQSQESVEDEQEQPFWLRRKSFYTKSYNPEEEIDDAEFKVYPKTSEVKMKLKAAIESNLLFKSLEPEQLSALMDAMVEVAVLPNEVVLRSGVDNDRFFVIESGEYEVIPEFGNKSSETVRSGTFGELTLVCNQPSQSTVISKTGGRLFALHRNEFRKIVTKTTHEIRKTLENFMENVPFLHDLPPRDKLKVADVMQLMNFTDGDSILKESQEADGLYLVLGGSVRVTECENGSGTNVRLVECGQYFGELPLSKPVKRNMTALARGSTKIAFLKTQAFERLTGPCLKVLKKGQDSRKPLANSEQEERALEEA